jgi:CheY-like chemotaxis protein
MRILIVDDDEAYCYLTAKALENTGYSVEVARNFTDALRILDDKEPLDLLVTDVVMPGQVNGFALARMARMRRFDLKVLYCTAYDVPSHEAIGKILRKPIADGQLIDEIEKALNSAPSSP